jgi:pimeloyl-ACP methyl ester carboxylesterase
MADRVVEFLDYLNIREPVVVGGLSMGGYVTLAFARRHTGRLCGLILADTKADPDDETGKANRDKMIALTNETGPGAVVEQMLPKLVGSDTAAQRPEIVAELRAIGLAQKSAGIIEALRAMRNRPDANSELPAIRVPTLILVGEQDAITPPDKAARLQSAIRDSELVAVPGAGHMSTLESPDAANQAIRHFLARLP